MLVVWVCPTEAPARKVAAVNAIDLDDAMSKARAIVGDLSPGETLCLYPVGKRPAGLEKRTETRVRRGMHPTKQVSYVQQSLRRTVDKNRGR